MPESTPDDTINDFDSFEAFREQAAETVSFIRAVHVNGFEIPNPSNLSPDQAHRYNELRLSLEELDRWPDTKNEDGEVTRLGALRDPHRKNGVLEEDYDTKLAKAVLGEDYNKFLAAGGRASDVKIAWTYMNQAVTKRAKQDPKSVPGVGESAEVAETD